MRMYFKTLFAFFASLCGVANAYQPTSTPFSQYGQIQNVQSYSSNPFWTPGSPYNQRMPQAVYVDGPEINAGDCQRVVSALVANVCTNMNNCVDTQLSDVRPTLMLQLSQLPGHNYATSCAGYIDSEFENYVKKYGHAGVVGETVEFPDATAPSNTGTQIEIKNPFEKQMPQWQQDVIERTKELENLQAQNGGNMGRLEKTAFPTTFADLSFQERMDIKAEGYEPYKDMKAYHPITLEPMEDYVNRMRSFNNESMEEYCKKYPEQSKIIIDAIQSIDVQAAIDNIENKINCNGADQHFSWQVQYWVTKVIELRKKDMNSIYKKHNNQKTII